VGHAAIPWSIAPLFVGAGWTTPKSTQHPLIIGKPGGQDVEPSGHGAGGGVKGGAGGSAGGDGTATPHDTVTASTDASPAQLDPRVYSKRKPAAWTLVVALNHAFPWSPLRVHPATPELLTNDSVPIEEPYM